MTLQSALESGVTVLTASRRLAYALRLSFAQRAQASGLTVWRSPQVLPWSTWLRQQWLEWRSFGNAPLQLLNAAQTRILWDEIVHHSDIAQPLLNPSNAARMAARSWQRLHEYSIDLATLSGSSSVETQALLTWARAFEQRCEALDAIDESRLAQLALRTQFVPAQTVCLAGFDTIPPVLQSLSELWQRAGKLVTPGEASSSIASIRKVMAADRQQEIELAAIWARARADEGLLRIGVVVSSLQDRRHDVRRVFEEAFAPASRRVGNGDTAIPVAIAAPEPLDEYPLVADALALLQLTDSDADSLLVGRLLRSPFLGAADVEQHVRALADVRLREEQRNQWDWMALERWASLTDCPQLQLAARAVATLVRAEGGVAKASAWSERWGRVLRASGWPGERTPSSIEFQTIAKLHEVLAQFGTLDAILGPISRTTALRRLRELTRETAFEAQSGPAAVTVIDVTTVAGMQFDALWVAGLDAARLPAPPDPDPLLPIDVQRAAGMPEASARGMLQLGRQQLDRLARSAPNVTLSWSHRDDDAELQPSPLLAAIPLQSADALLIPSLQPLGRQLFAQRPLLQTLADHFAPPVPPQLARGGSQTIELQSRCAFRAQAQLRLNAVPLSVVSLGIEPRERGTMLHKALELLWQRLGSQQRLLALNDADLRALLEEVARQTAATTLRATTRVAARLGDLEVSAIVLQLTDLMKIERERPPFTVRSAEHTERFSLGGLFIRLKPDRIDGLVDGGDLLVDYKLGESHKPSQWLDTVPGRPRKPQLPLYALAHMDSVSAIAFVVAAPGTVEYRGWSDGAAVAAGVATYPPRRSKNAPPDWLSLLKHWRTVLTALAERYVAGDALVDPLPQECRTCHLSTFCRIHEMGSAVEVDETDDE